MTRSGFILAALAASTLAACALFGGGDYQYISPPDLQGQNCARQCESSRDQCRVSADDLATAEQQRCLTERERDYVLCKAGSTKGDGYAETCERSSCTPKPQYASCTRDFNACYEGCGGDVIQR